MTKFFVLTGFLGSGKTTLLRRFLDTPDAANTGVIVNEVGEIGLDGAILTGSGGVPMTQLANGCVCCSLGDDLALTVDALIAGRAARGEPPLRRIVLETSGISRPGPILRALGTLAAHRLAVEVVCTFDCTRGAATAAFDEAAAQFAGAHVVVLTKQDADGALDADAAGRVVAGFNPLAPIVEDAGAAFSLERRPERLSALRCDDAAAHPRVAVLLVRQADAVAWDDAATWLDNLAGRLGDRLLRLKGLLDIAGAPRKVMVQSVGTTFSDPRLFDGAGDGFLVVIGRDIDADMLREVGPALPFSFNSAAMAA